MFLHITLAHLCQYACMPTLVSRGGFLTLDMTTSEAWQSLGYSGLACKGEVNARADKQVKESKNMRARISSQKYAPLAAPRQTDRKQLSCQRLACASPFLWLLAPILHVYMYARICVCTYVPMYVCTYVCMYARMYVCVYVCMYVCMLGMYVCMYVRMYVCMYAGTTSYWGSV